MNHKRKPQRKNNTSFFKFLFFADFYEADGYLLEVYCNQCSEWKEYYFEEIITDKDKSGCNWGTKVNCKGCGLDITHRFLRQSDETLARIRNDNTVRWITLEEKFSYWE